MQIRKWAELKFSINEKTECNQSLKFKFYFFTMLCNSTFKKIEAKSNSL